MIRSCLEAGAPFVLGGALLACLLLPGAAVAQCPVGPENACVINLKGKERPNISANCSAKPWTTYLRFGQANGLSNSNADLWWETVVGLNLDPANGCRCAHFRVQYDAEPSGWTTHVADSPTSDGYGGDGTPWCAELHVSNDHLTVWSAIVEPGKKGHDRLLYQALPALGGAALEVEVCDQFLEILLSSPDERKPALDQTLHALNAQHLFALAGQPTYPGADEKADYGIYAAFNRVVKQLDGAPVKDRVGTGVRRVEIYLTP